MIYGVILQSTAHDTASWRFRRAALLIWVAYDPQHREFLVPGILPRQLGGFKLSTDIQDPTLVLKLVTGVLNVSNGFQIWAAGEHAFHTAVVRLDALVPSAFAPAAITRVDPCSQG